MPDPFSLKPTPAPAANLFGEDLTPADGDKPKKRKAKSATAGTGLGDGVIDPNLPPNLGKPLKVEVSDFSDPNRPKTCLEVDFPLVPINALSGLEGNAGKPIYQMSKWWARRRSCVFRALLLAAAMKAPVRRHPDGQPMLGPDGQPLIDEDSVDRAVWDAYYANHQAAENFKHLRVLDPFMGGGTTLVEGSRLGFQVAGVDLNPVAWFIVKNELACTDPAEVKAFFDQIEAEVKPQIQPFYVTDPPGVGGNKGRWFQIAEGGDKPMPEGFDPVTLPPAERKSYRYEGPEVIYTFWAKHGPCAKPGCGHRTPIFRSPVVATKKLGVKYLECTCKNKACGLRFHAELGDARIAPDAEHVILGNEHPYTVVTQPFAQALLNYEKDGREVLDARITFLTEHLESEPGLHCPACGTFAGQFVRDILAKHKDAKTYASIKKKDFSILPSGQGKKPVYCTLLIDPEWLRGSPGESDSAGAGKTTARAEKEDSRPSSAQSGSAAPWAGAAPYTGELGGYIDAPIDATAAWYRERLKNLRLIEVRGQCAAGEDPGNGFPTVVSASRDAAARARATSAPASGRSGTRSNSSGASSGPVGGSSGSPGRSSGSAGTPSGRVGTSSGWAGGSSKSAGTSSGSAGRSSGPAGGKRGGAPEAREAPPGGSGPSPEAPEEDAEWGEEAAGLPPTITLRDGRVVETGRGTVPKRSAFACGSCGLRSDLLDSCKAYTDRARMESKDAAQQRSLPVAVYCIQCYDPAREAEGHPYGGRYFKAPDAADIERLIAAEREWNARKESDLAAFWPRSALPYTWMTHHLNGGIPNWGFTHWYKFFNPRQLLTHALLLRSIIDAKAKPALEDFVLGAVQQYLRNQNMMCFWNPQRDTPEPFFSQAHYHPKQQVVENSVFGSLGRGNWLSSVGTLLEASEWASNPWEKVEGAAEETVKSDHVPIGDPILPGSAKVVRGSSTEMPAEWTSTFDNVITDPPFGDNVFYGDLSNYFYVWLRLALKDRYPAEFGPEFVPRSQEAVADRSRFPGAGGTDDDETAMSAASIGYQTLLTACWAECRRVMKDGGTMAFTFHHAAPEQWEVVLRSLFDAGWLLEATYPIRSDETKGEGGQFGSRKMEYDIIHVCRKRLEEPKAVSWPKMRQWVKSEFQRLRPLMEAYKGRGLPAADIHVVLLGKALEFYSRHYGKVLVSAPGSADGPGADTPLSIRDALLGINMLLDESSREPGEGERPPSLVQPVVYQYLRLFGTKASYSRDEVSKLLRGTTVQQSAFEKVNSSGGPWVVEADKVVRRATIRERFARMKARSRREMKSELDQAQFLIGAAFEGSGVNIEDEFQRHTFLIRPGVEALLEWFGKAPAGRDEPDVPKAAALALALFRAAKEARIIKLRTDGQQRFEFADPIQNEEWESAAAG